LRLWKFTEHHSGSYRLVISVSTSFIDSPFPSSNGYLNVPALWFIINSQVFFSFIHTTNNDNHASIVSPSPRSARRHYPHTTDHECGREFARDAAQNEEGWASLANQGLHRLSSGLRLGWEGVPLGQPEAASPQLETIRRPTQLSEEC